MEHVEFTGKTTEDALRAAEEHFGVSLDQLEVEVVSAGSSGFFGILGSKKAVIKARPQGKSAADEVARMVADITESAAPAAKPTPPKPPSAKAVPRPPRPKAAPKPEAPPLKPQPQAPPEPKSPPSAAPSGPVETPAQPAAKAQAPPPSAAKEKAVESGPEQAEVVEFAKQVLERLTQSLDPKAMVEVVKGEQGLGLSITGADSGVVICRRGQTLDALQYLTTRIVSHKFGKAVHLSVDAGGYRQRRRTTLEETARRMADKARTSRKAQSMGPLNSQERRLVHLALRSQRGISTVSRGKGDLKKVIITPR